jgi:glycosyltransferase involved in cell wall biosynthesis
MRISCVVVAHNEEALLGRCLASLVQALAATPCDAEIIVVDNASTDRTAAIAASFPGVRVVPEPHKGITWARRAGFRASTGDLIANLDADVIVPAPWLPRVIREFTADPALQGLSGPHVYYDAARLVRVMMRAFYAYWFVTDTIAQALFGTGSMLQGGNFILRRSALEQIGGFDTSIAFYGEDTDIGRRVRKVGRVKWTFGLPVYASGRRWARPAAGLAYMLDYVWLAFFGTPFAKTHRDIRLPARGEG